MLPIPSANMQFMYLTKAFDTISHSILFRKLQYQGINGSAHDWFKSYLSIRQQCAVAGKEKTETLNIITGVAQGRIRRPLLFILYINNLVNASKLL